MIVLLDSFEMDFHGQPASEAAPSTGLGGQEDNPPEPVVSRPHKVVSTRSWHSRSLLPDQLLLNSYIPPHGQTLPVEEVSAPGPEGAQDIIERWKPFNHRESPATHLEELYPEML